MPECPIEAAEAPEVVQHGILPLAAAEDGVLSAAPAAMAAGVPELVLRCRFAQCVAMMARERLRHRDIEDCGGLKAALEEWMARYLKPDAQFIRPLYQAQVTVRPDAAQPERWLVGLRFRLWPPADALSTPQSITVAVPAP